MIVGNRRKIIRLFIALVLSAAVIAYPMTAYAYGPYEGCKWPSPYCSFKYGGTSLPQTYFRAISYGRLNWNDTGLVSLSVSSTSSNLVYCDNYSSSWYGLNSFSYSGTAISSFTIYLNKTTLESDYSGNNLEKAATSTMVHEFGHTYGLDDIPDYTVYSVNPSFSIMSYQRDRTTLTSPTVWDKGGIQYLYPLKNEE